MKKFNLNCFFVDRDNFICKLINGKTVLHIGCTDSPNYEYAFLNNRLLHLKLAKLSSKLKGIDISKNGIDYLKSKDSSLDISLVDITNISKIDDFIFPYDFIIFSDVLEHIDNPGLALNNILETMTDKSQLIITVPNSFSFKSFLRVFFGNEFVHEDHVCYYSFSTLTRLLSNYSLKPVDNFAYVGGGNSIFSKIINPIFYFIPWLADGIGMRIIKVK